MKSIPETRAPGSNPSGLCQCGCGQQTPLAKYTDPRDGSTKGEPLRFITNHHSRRPIADRFWSHVDTSGGMFACWPWTGFRGRPGYGQLGRNLRANRVAYELHNGPIPPDGVICHTCDNPSCVNPAHLFLGTQLDNIADATRKGRVRHGEGHYHAKLTADDVREIRQRYAAGGISYSRLASLYGISIGTVGKLVRRQRWQHIE